MRGSPFDRDEDGDQISLIYLGHLVSKQRTVVIQHDPYSLRQYGSLNMEWQINTYEDRVLVDHLFIQGRHLVDLRTTEKVVRNGQDYLSAKIGEDEVMIYAADTPGKVWWYTRDEFEYIVESIANSAAEFPPAERTDDQTVPWADMDRAKASDQK